MFYLTAFQSVVFEKKLFNHCELREKTKKEKIKNFEEK